MSFVIKRSAPYEPSRHAGSESTMQAAVERVVAHVTRELDARIAGQRQQVVVELLAERARIYNRADATLLVEYAIKDMREQYVDAEQRHAAR